MCFGCSKELIETVLLSTHNIWLGLEIRDFFNNTPLSGGLTHSLVSIFLQSKLSQKEIIELFLVILSISIYRIWLPYLWISSIMRNMPWDSLILLHKNNNETEQGRTACTSDQLLCYLLSGKYKSLICFRQNFNIQAILCSYTSWLEPYVVTMPMDRFSHAMVYVIKELHCIL